MEGYAYIPLIASALYLYIFIIFISARKTPLIVDFAKVMLFMLFWAGGSTLMRIRLAGQVSLWFHLSILGIAFACYALERFLCHFAGRKFGAADRICSNAFIGAALFNAFTNSLLCPPRVVTGTDGVEFIYENIGAGAYVLYTAIFLNYLLIFIRAIQCSRSTDMTWKQFAMLITGTSALAVGNFMILIPRFSRFPYDMASGIVFALCCVYVLMSKQIFEFYMTAPRYTYYFMSAVILAFITWAAAAPVDELLTRCGDPVKRQHLSVLCMITVLAAFCVYKFVIYIGDNVIVKGSTGSAEEVNRFHHRISSLMNMADISAQTCSYLKKNIPEIRSIRVVVADEEGDYRIISSSEVLEENRVMLGRDSAVAEWLRKNHTVLTEQTFMRSTEYKMMWEAEKTDLIRYSADYLFPLEEGGQLTGVLAVSVQHKEKGLPGKSLDLVNSLLSVISSALQNAQMYEKALHDAMTDDLTGLYNRKYFMKKTGKLCEENPGGIRSLMLISVDDFRLYNQLYGTAAGDDALVEIGEVIQETIGDRNFAARLSGKEFAVMMPDQDVSAARRLSENIRKQISELHSDPEEGTDPLKSLTVSIGVCSMPFEAHTVKQLMERADMAVFQAKRRGKNCVVFYSVQQMAGNDGTQQKENRAELYSTYASTIYALCAAIDAKDHYTFTHSNNVAYYSTKLAETCGLNEDTVELVREAALLHDIGKIGIPENVLNKQGSFTPEEIEIMKKHPENAVAIIRHLPSLDYVIPAVVGHHERWDGQGYPRGLKGEDIPLTARILTVADCFDAMTSRRVYKEPIPVERAVQLMEAGENAQFDPALAELFIKNIRNGTIKVLGNAGQRSEG